MRSKKRLENEIQDEMLIPEWLFKEQAPLKKIVYPENIETVSK